MTRATSAKTIAAKLLLSFAASVSGFAQPLRIAMTAADTLTASGISNVRSFGDELRYDGEKACILHGRF